VRFRGYITIALRSSWAENRGRERLRKWISSVKHHQTPTFKQWEKDCEKHSHQHCDFAILARDRRLSGTLRFDQWVAVRYRYEMNPIHHFELSVLFCPRIQSNILLSPVEIENTAQTNLGTYLREILIEKSI
jgi:hypothetical protein